MKNLKNKLLSKTFIFAIISLLISSLSVRFMFNNKGFTFHDETQIANLYEYFVSFNNGHFPPRWASDVHFGYGSPLLSFNYQLPYYLGYPLYKIGFGLVHTFKLLMATSVLLGALGMYLLGLSLGSPLVALTGSVIYTYLPYHALDVFVRGTLGESWAIAVFPFVILSLIKAIKKPSTLRIILAGVSLALLILAHQIAFMFALPVVFVLLLSMSLESNFKDRLLTITKALFWALGLSSYYLVPLFLEKGFIQQTSPFNFYDHFPFIKQLIYSKWGYGASVIGPYDGLSFQLGFVFLFLVIVSLIALVKSPLSKQNRPILSLVGIIVALLYLMNIRSSWLWETFSLSQTIQFPWRLLMVTVWIAPILYYFLTIRFPFMASFKMSLIILAVSIFTVLPMYRPGELADHTDSYFLRRFLPKIILVNGETISKDYLFHTEDYVPLPADATRPAKLPSKRLEAEDGTIVKELVSKPYEYLANLNTPSTDNLTFQAFYYPGWKALLDQQPLKITPDQMGFISLIVPKGDHKLQILFTESPVRLLSDIISLVIFLLTVQLIIYHSYKKYV